MRLRQAAQAPVALQIGETHYLLPKFTFDDWVKWATELDSARTAMALEGADAEKRVQLLTFYNILPTDLSEMRRRLYTPEGINRVCGTCMKRGGVPEKEIPSILAGAHSGDLVQLVTELADLESEKARADREAAEKAAAEAAKKAAESGKGGEATESPLTTGSKAESSG